METATLPQYQLLPVDQIVPSPYQARKEFDPTDLQGLADSMQADGLLEPILVRLIKEGYELISGERRLRAAKLLGWTSIEAKVMPVATETEAAVKGLNENLQRQNLNPIEEAEGFKMLSKMEPTWSQARIAEVVGRDRSYVTQSMGLLKLPGPIQADVSRLTLSRSHALELMRLPTNEQQMEVAKLIPGRLTREETRRLIDQLLNHKTRRNNNTKKKYDPLEILWVSMNANPEVPKEHWQVSYHSGDTWSFKVDLVGLDRLAALETWLEGLLGGVRQARQEQTKGQAILNKMISKMPQKADKSVSQSNNRLPRSAPEMTELEALAAQGPEAVYARVFGPSDFNTKAVAGKTWADIGCPDPIAATHQLVENVKLANQT